LQKSPFLEKTVFFTIVRGLSSHLLYRAKNVQLLGYWRGADPWIPYTTIALKQQGEKPNNTFCMFDLGSLGQDNNRWSVRMKSIPFRTARTRPLMSMQKLGASVLMMGLAMTASARDGATPKEQTPSIQAAPTPSPAKATHKPRRWFQIGIASWYGSHFQGRETAAGEKYDMNQMTCAHPTLPMGTWLRVTNLKNRRTAFVRVNDRGPVLDDRIVDLSAAAARAVGLAGIGKVKLEAVRQSDPELARALVAQVQVPVFFNSASH
jgi:rare lipoprotein A